MAILSRDTSRDAEDVQMEILRHASPQKKAEMLRGLHRSALALTRQGLRRRHPTASGTELERLRAELWLGKDVAGRAYRSAPEPAPLNGDLMDPLAIASLVARALDELGVPYFLGGSLASTFHGEPRFTRDADLVAELQPRHAEPLTQALAPTFYADAESIHRAIARKGSFNVIHLATAFKVDIFVSSSAPSTAPASPAGSPPKARDMTSGSPAPRTPSWRSSTGSARATTSPTSSGETSWPS
jgi:hypothetical protein